MTTFFKRALLFTGLLAVLFFNSCKEDLKLPDNLVEFESDALGFESSETELTILINLSRAASTTGDVNVQMELTGLTYGTDFTTEPAAVANVVTVTVPAAATSSTLKIIKTSGVLLDGDEQIKFTFQDIDESLVLGEKSELILTFSEIVAEDGGFEVTGGGPTYPNKVFVDLSANRQIAVARNTWDLSFYSGDDFRVTLNSSNGMLARATNKTDMNAVTAADTVGFSKQFSVAAIFSAINGPIPDWIPQAITWIDDPAGDLTKTAIAEISATASVNKVYIINRGTGPGAAPAPALGMKKIRIIRNGTGYTLQHADINANSFSEIQIVKNTDAEFQYVHFNTGEVTVEPNTGKWDFAWTGFTNSTPYSANPGEIVPYYFQDVILTNRGVETYQVMTSPIAYDVFAEADLAGLTFNTSQVSIGSSWRSGGGPGGPPAIRTDRYYIVRDADDNYYKLKFTALTTNAERGRPQFDFALVKKGS